MRRTRYRYTAKRKAAFKRAQLISARKRRGKKVALIGMGVGVLAVGAGAGIVLGRKHAGREGSPIQVIKKTEAPPAAKPENMNVAKETVDKPHKAARRVLITGSRNMTDSSSVYKVLDKELKKHGSITVVHGAHRSGADRFAREWTIQAMAKYGDKVKHDPHPAEWSVYGNAAGPIRNQKMVDLGADIVYGFPRGVSRGTRDAMSKARIAGIKVKQK